jgi:hypothetical protein
MPVRLGSLFVVVAAALVGTLAPMLAAQSTPPPEPKAPATGATPSPKPGPDEQQFRNLNESFELIVPKNWRALAPNEARRIGENPNAPTTLCLAQPRAFYAVGPVDAWLAGDFTGAWIYVVETEDEWYVEDDFAEVLAESWRRLSESKGEQNELSQVERWPVGLQQYDAVVAQRRCTPPKPRPALHSLDVHSPCGGRQLTLSFQCVAEAFPRWEPEFQRMLASLRFARPPRSKGSLGDRLWTPILAGGAVSLVLLVLYKRRQRLSRG